MADARIVHEGFWQQHGGSAAAYIPDFAAAIFSSSPINVSRLAIQGIVSFTGFSHGHWLFHQAQNQVNFYSFDRRSLCGAETEFESLHIWSCFFCQAHWGLGLGVVFFGLEVWQRPEEIQKSPRKLRIADFRSDPVWLQSTTCLQQHALMRWAHLRHERH